MTTETTEIGLKLRIKYVVIIFDFMKFTLWQGKPVLKKPFEESILLYVENTEDTIKKNC